MKVVVAIVFSGKAIQEKVSKICQSMEVHVYNVPRAATEQIAMLEAIEREMQDHKAITAMSDKRQCDLLSTVAARLLECEKRVLKEKAVCVYIHICTSA